MSDTPEADRVRELFGALGPIRIRRMFGGAGVYLDDAMFALIAEGQLFLKTDAALAADLEAAGSAPFVYEANGKPTVMSYWRLPAEAEDDPEQALVWARRALAPARAAAAARREKPARRR